jgi:hypothetical protein
MTIEPRAWLSRVPDWAIFSGFCLLLSLQLVGPLSQQSATFDEPANLVSGYLSLRFGDDRLIPQNLPLVKLLSAAPLTLHPDRPLPPSPQPWSAEAQYRYASRFLYQLNGGDDLLLRGRLAVLPLSLLLGLGVFLWAKQLCGRSAAILALALYAFEPNVLAHSALITTDVATACFMFWTFFGWYLLMEKITWPRLVLAGAALGLGLVSKFTALSLFPIVLLVGSFVALGSHDLHVHLTGLTPRAVSSRPRKLLVVLGLLAGMGLMAMAVIWAGYRFTYESATAPIATYPDRWEQSTPANPVQQKLLALALEAKILPETYLYGLSHQLRLGGYSEAYLMGEIRPGGWWYYFLVTLAVKTPLALLLAVLLAIVVAGRYWRSNKLAGACLLIPLVAYFVMISGSGWNIGHRHLLPIIPLQLILVSALTGWAVDKSSGVRLGLAGLLLWYVVSSVSIHPHYLAYFNELVGGPEHGHRYLIDSNLDWGQDLKGLKRYMEEHQIDRVWLSYFGQASPEYYGIEYNYLPSYDIFEPKNLDPRVFRIAALPPLPGTVAVSATLLQGGALHTVYGLGPTYFEYYRRLTPVAKIGYSIFIYQVP